LKIRVSGETLRYATTLGLLAMACAAASLSLRAQPDSRSDDTIESRTAPASAFSQTPEMIIRHWPERAQAIAQVMIEKYGPPNRLSLQALVWYNNGPWQKSVVYRKASARPAARQDNDFLEQTIGYQVPEDKINDLRLFDPRITVNRMKDILSCRSENEGTNFLVLNLADEIVTDQRNVEGARAFSRKTQRLAQSGKTSPYMERFLFELFDEKSSDPEYPAHL
jgi:hypothetical protein